MKKYIYFVLLLLWPFISQAQTTYIVSVGIADYMDPQVSDLYCTEIDVECFNNVMRNHTNQIYTFLGSQASHANVCAGIRRVFAKAGPNDAVIFFFAGHGYPGGFCCYDMSGNSGGLTYDEIAALFLNCRAKHKMVFADTCFSGGLRTKKKKNNSATNSVRRGDVMFFLSSRTNETSQEMRNGPNGSNGLFTYHLVKGLRGGADRNRDRIITAKELYDFVHEGVIRTSGNTQHPVMWGRFNNTMPVLNWNR